MAFPKIPHALGRKEVTIMAIRPCIKALIIKDDQILLEKGSWLYFKDFYSLPGGGQHPYETQEEALRRELLEETGLSVRPLRLCALKEEIFTKQSVREAYPDFSHRLNLIYLAQIEEVPPVAPTHIDTGAEPAIWVPLPHLQSMPETLFPEGLLDALPRIMAGEMVILPPSFYDGEV